MRPFLRPERALDDELRMVDFADPKRRTRGETRGPRWIYVLGVIVIAAIVVAIAVHLAGGGLHRHELP